MRPVHWIIPGLAVFLIAASLSITIYRLGLPTEGWRFTRDTTGTGQALIFERNLAGAPSPLLPGDRLVGVAGQRFEDMLARAILRAPLRPAGWAAGQSADYAVQRGAHTLVMAVPLVRIPAGVALANLASALLMDPGALITLLIGAFVYARHPGSRPAQLLLLFSAAVFASNNISQAVTGSNVTGPAELFDPAAYWPAQAFNALIWPLLIAPLFLHLLLSFPVVFRRGPLLFHLPRPVGLLLLYGLMPALTLAAGLFSRGPLDFLRVWSTLSYLDFLLILAGAVLLMVYKLRRMYEGAARAQVRWVAWGTVVTCLGALAGSLAISLPLNQGAALAVWAVSRLLLLAFPIAVAIAIQRYRLFEIEIIIHNTLVYGLLTALLGAIYVASIVLLQFIFRALTGTTSPLALVVTTLATAALFTPLRGWIQRGIDRRMFHQKYNAEKTLAAFGSAAQVEVDLEDLSARLVQVIEQTMQPKSITVWFKPEMRARADYSKPEPLAEPSEAENRSGYSGNVTGGASPGRSPARR